MILISSLSFSRSTISVPNLTPSAIANYTSAAPHDTQMEDILLWLAPLIIISIIITLFSIYCFWRKGKYFKWFLVIFETQIKRCWQLRSICSNCFTPICFWLKNSWSILGILIFVMDVFKQVFLGLILRELFWSPVVHYLFQFLYVIFSQLWQFFHYQLSN